MPVNGFFIDYKVKDGYLTCDGTVTFYTGHDGLSVSCDYDAVGTVLDAATMNEIKAHIEKVDKILDENDSDHTTFSNSIIGAKKEAENNLKQHNIDTEAHSDIRQQIDINYNLNVSEHAQLRRSLTDHNTSQSCHADIREEIAADKANLANYKIEASKSLIDAIDFHNLSEDCHSDIRLALATNSETFAAALNQLESDTSAALSHEEAVRTSADNQLRSALEAEAQARIKADKDINDAMFITNADILALFPASVVTKYKERNNAQ